MKTRFVKISGIDMWPLLLFLALYLGVSFGQLWVGRLLWTHSTQVTEPPWYFIGQDLVGGLLCLGGLILTLIVAVRARRRFGAGSWMASWMAAISMGYPAAQAFLILLRTTHIWDPSAAASDWRTFDQYHRDPVRWVVFALSVIAGLAFAWLSRGFFEVRQAERARQP